MGAGTEPPGPAAGPAPSSVYLDYNATTPLAPEVAQALGEAACQAWGNPSSAHPAGKAWGRGWVWGLWGAVTERLGLAPQAGRPRSSSLVPGRAWQGWWEAGQRMSSSPQGVRR